MMYALIFRPVNALCWEMSNYTSMNCDYLEQIALDNCLDGKWEDWRLEYFTTDYEWIELTGLVNDSNFGDEQAAIILGIDNAWWYDNFKKLIH